MALQITRKWLIEPSTAQMDTASAPFALVTAWSPERNASVRLQLLHQAMAMAHSGPLPEVAFPPRTAPQAAGWLLSYAHSGEWLLAAACAPARDRPPMLALGIDIERTQHRDHVRLTRFLGWQQESTDLAHFYRRWTLAEALLKALGGTHAKATFNALDSALQTAVSAPAQRSTVLGRWRYCVHWPELEGGVTACWLVAQPVADRSRA